MTFQDGFKSQDRGNLKQCLGPVIQFSTMSKAQAELIFSRIFNTGMSQLSSRSAHGGKLNLTRCTEYRQFYHVYVLVQLNIISNS